MGYYTDIDLRNGAIISKWLERISLTVFLCMIGAFSDSGIWLLILFIYAVGQWGRETYEKGKNAYMIFEEEGITIVDYGETKYAYMDWNRIDHVYHWNTSNDRGNYFILSERELPPKLLNQMLDYGTRHIENGLVIDIGGEDGQKIETIIRRKLAHIPIEKKNSWI